MTDNGRMKVAILGGGQRTRPLLELLGQLHDIQIVELTPQGPASERTSSLSLPHARVNQDLSILVDGARPHLLIDTTGPIQSSESISNPSSLGVEVLKGNGAKLLLELAEQEHQVRGQISHTEKLATVGTLITLSMSFSGSVKIYVTRPIQQTSVSKPKKFTRQPNALSPCAST